MAQHSSVSGSFSATGQSASFRPGADLDTERREFAVVVAGTFVGTVSLECQADGTNWVIATKADGSAHTYTAPTNLLTITAAISGAPYRLNCTAYTSGTATYFMGQ